MPELPEVETVVRGLRETLYGRTITHFWYDWENIVRPNPTEFAAKIIGQQIQQMYRRAKYIVLPLDRDVLVVHLKMTGRLYVATPQTVDHADKWVHAKFTLDDGRELRFSDSRKFGRVFLTDQLSKVTGDLGPEPLEDAFTETVFRERLAHHKRILKALLLDQTFIAGVGNIYADEALHRAKIHPLRTANSLTDAEISALYGTIRAALQDGVAREGASVNWYRKPDGTKGKAQDELFVYGREGQACFQCGTTLVKTWVTQRGTHYCPHCQIAPAKPSN